MRISSIVKPHKQKIKEIDEHVFSIQNFNDEISEITTNQYKINERIK